MFWTISVKKWIFAPKSRTRFLCYLEGWKNQTAYTGGGGEGGELKQYSISVHYSGNINVNISPDTGRNDLARIEFPKEVVNPNRPMLPWLEFTIGAHNVKMAKQKHLLSTQSDLKIIVFKTSS